MPAAARWYCDPRIPPIGVRPRKDSKGRPGNPSKSAKNACPYFTIQGDAFQCPFTRLDGVFSLTGPKTAEEAEAEQRKIEGVRQIYDTCVHDKSHAKTAWPETGENALLRIFKPARPAAGQSARI